MKTKHRRNVEEEKFKKNSSETEFMQAEQTDAASSF